MIETDKTFGIKYVDASGMCTFNRCPAAYLFSRLMGLHAQDSNTIAMDYGTDMHLAIPHCYKEDIRCVETAAAIFEIAWNARGYGNDDPKRNPQTARASLAEFQRLHKPSKCQYEFVEFAKDIIAPNAQTVSDNELPFLVDIGASLPFAGRIDAVVKLKMDGSVWPLDYKNSSEVSPRYFSNFDGAPQSVGYTLALSIIMNNHPHGMILEALRVSAANVENQMYPIYVSENDIRLFVELAKRTSDNIEFLNEAKMWPQMSSACAPYSMFGQPGRICEYKDICLMKDWKEMVKYYKKTEPFHPFTIKDGG